MTRTCIFNCNGDTWDWCERIFQHEQTKMVPNNDAILKMELDMAKKADHTADIVWFDGDEMEPEFAIKMGLAMNTGFYDT